MKWRQSFIASVLMAALTISTASQSADKNPHEDPRTGPAAYTSFYSGVDAYERGDFATAFEEWSSLAEQGSSIARVRLGTMYKDGQGIPRDYKIAAKLYRLAADQGNEYAQAYLGELYIEGLGVSQNYKTAAELFKLSAKKEVARAQFNLGLLYHEGLGVKQDKKSAFKWYKLAAEQGEVASQFNLGNMYYEDYEDVRAYMWWSVAINNGSPQGKKSMDLLKANMTTQQLAKAKQLTRRCIQKNFEGC